VVEHNVFERCNGEVEIISSKSCGNVYRWNLFLRCEGALTLRHGNRCTVEGNVFLGEGERNTGGVRIVGEDHRVFNNYFAGLRGDGSRAALSCMMGIPDGPLNGYAQVRRAIVVFNTFVDCAHPFAVGVDGGEEATLPPMDVTIASNIMLDQGRTRLQLPADVAGASTAMNQLEGGQADQALPSGFRLAELRLERGADGLLRPTAASGAVDAGSGEFEFIIDDIDGEPRGRRPDAGCDEWSQRPQQARAFRVKSIGPDWRAWTPSTEGDE
jgi:poly(beta-D-mannuronate) lyase